MTTRREAILRSSLETFTRFGYRKTSMDTVARAAHVSRPGLYFLFASKEELFRATISRALEDDLAAVDDVLTTEAPLRDRLLRAFERWAGRYIGPGGRDVSTVIDENPDLLGSVPDDASRRFSALITRALDAESTPRATEVTQTLISLSIGIKHQVETPAEFVSRLSVGIDLVLP